MSRPPFGLHPAGLILAYVGLALLPLVLATLQGLPVRNFFRELSSGLVMVGFAMLLAQFVLSGRFRRISGRVGIDLTMRFHQLAGWAVLAFILVHPFLYAAPRLHPEPADALVALNRMFTSEGLRTGVVGWWLLVLLVPLAAFRDRLPARYELWRLSHGLGALAIAVLGADHTLRVGTYAADPWLRAFWIALAALAVLSLVYVYLLKPLVQLRAPYRVAANRQVADRMWEVTVEPERGAAIDFAPGQFVWLNLGHSPFSLTEHPFSISSAPVDRPRIAFTIKESGDFTNGIGEVPVGTRAYLDGPHGSFTPAGREATGLALIAGGVGFAPIMSILRHLRAERYPHPVRLVYGNRVETQILYRDEIEALREVLDFEAHLVLSELPPGWGGEVGELTPEVLHACLDLERPAEWLYFVCGPTPMMDSVERTLQELRVPARRIVSERFSYS